MAAVRHRKLLRWLLFLISVWVTPPAQGQVVEPDRWFLRTDPYLWTANLSGTATIGDVTVPVESGGDGLLSGLAFLGNVIIEVGRNRWSVAAEVGTVEFNDSTALGGSASGTSLDYSYRVFLGRLFGVYRLTSLNVPQSVSALAGGRYVSHRLETRTSDTQSGSEVDFSEDWIDPIIGVRGHTPIAGNFSVAVGGDVGGFGIGSDISWSATGVLGWRFSRPLGLTLGYRYLYLDYSNRDSGAPTEFSYKGSQHGLLIGVLLKL